MSEKKPSVEELTQRIDQLLVVLKEISEDLAEISKHLKTTGAPAPASATIAPAVPTSTARMRSVAETRTIFPKELENMLTFEETEKYIVIKPRQYLGSENFAKIASLVRSAGGEYISAGKESHFRVSRELR
jgi:chlorite dismutase